MKKLTVITLMLALLILGGCEENKKDLYLPETQNDKIYATLGGQDGIHQGEGYTIAVPVKNYRYEKDFEDGNLEEKWEHIKKDDVEIKVTTYKNMDAATARGKFSRENNDYFIEDGALYGISVDGMLGFRLHESVGNVYIVSWEYPQRITEELLAELSNIADTFKLAK